MARELNTDRTPTRSCGGAIFVSIELSKRRWLIAVHKPTADRISRYNVAGGDGDALVKLLLEIKGKAQHRLGQQLAVYSCFEAGFDGFWLHRLLVANGIESHVVDPASIQVNRRARRAKTDRLDVESLLRALMAFCRGEPRVCSMVRVPSVEDEDQRRLHRGRERLIKERVQHCNRIGGLLATQGIRDFQPMRRDWPAGLEHLTTGDGRPLSVHLKAEIANQCRRLALVIEQLKDYERQQTVASAQASAVMATDPASGGRLTAEEKIALLRRLRGIGPIFAGTLVREVFYRDFDNRREVASYVGLAPTPFNSGEMVRDQGISKAGNRRARTMAIEMAWLWLRHQPTSALAAWFRDRVGAMKGRLRRITIVALARKLIVALWRFLETGLIPTGAVIRS